MKIFEYIDDPKLIKKIKANAKTVGLDQIDFDKNYLLKKSETKNPSPHGYNNGHTAKGAVRLVGTKDLVWISVVSSAGGWFKTSPIKSCKKIGDGFEIETENSIYLMMEDIWK